MCKIYFGRGGETLKFKPFNVPNAVYCSSMCLSCNNNKRKQFSDAINSAVCVLEI